MQKTLLPCCPLCDSAIEVYEPASVYVEDGYKALAHEDCIVSLDDDYEDDDDVYGQDDLESLTGVDDDDDEDEDY